MVVEVGRDIVVLIVEDEVDNREIMRAVVEELLGYKAVLANDGIGAIEAATTHQPSVILMDLMMPTLDGYEATRRIKTNPLTSHIPVIAITALGRPTDRQRAVEEGADAYVSKPFDIDTLVAVIERYASGQQ
ncbi:MAG TPA: response regulator [Chloroflexia bacterium]|nr:response regulator [Chloroflexia bacterium]